MLVIVRSRADALDAPFIPRLCARAMEADRPVRNGSHHVEVEEMMFTPGKRIRSGQFDLAALDMVDGADMISIGSFDRHVFSNFGCIEHRAGIS